ncbi:unnamed protein product [Caenorhabditis angaria]|uniref:Uncharacterized protein n=1 Tax=Caenorhabditis angaria TaxID=860376 RepID=A0A9P1N4K0_9PELO|nr:unnamed protein product [Caenorhabditis angaria]
MIYEIINATYGSMSEDDLEKMVEELTNDPTLVRDIVPFLIGGYSEEVRKSLSYTAADMFLWVAYEDQLIDLDANFYLWNDKVLGNCFTFNHMNSSYEYLARNSGFHGGLAMEMNLQQSEYLPWTETASVMVFTSTSKEVITSESVRINCEPGFGSRIQIERADYYRLSGKYGTCVTSIKQVAAYYYDGDYTTDGCIRSCYQFVVNQTCSCMDPRYPMPTDATSCNITQKNCIDNLVEEKGDPSDWSTCICPNPCSQIVYSSQLSRAPITQKITECEKNGQKNTTCYAKYEDMAQLEICLPKLEFLIYQEKPLMDFNKFLSYLGGILSILIGVSIVSFIELFFLFMQIFYVLIFNKRI